MSQPVIEIRGLTKRFGTGETAVTALENIDLTIHQGDIFGIIGLSGAGKSTLVRCMNLLERPTEGTVRVNGEELTALKNRQLRQARRSIGMIFQSFNLLMQRTALENITFPLELEGMPKKQAREKARELLKIVGLSDRENAYPAQLSGGQKQRIAIARAIANDPKVLLCDEATSALDPNTTAAILDLLKTINQTMGVTIVVITHEMKVIEKICSHVAVIDHSHIVEEGDVQEIFANPKSRIARELILPKDGGASGISPQVITPMQGGRKLRIVFEGGSAYEPLIASLAIDCGIKVNILGADTRNIDGKAYGFMVIGLPENPADAQRAMDYIHSQQGVHAEEVTEDNA